MKIIDLAKPDLFIFSEWKIPLIYIFQLSQGSHEASLGLNQARYHFGIGG